MPSILVAGDVEVAMIFWAKSCPRITAIVGGQIGFELPNNTPPLPYLSLDKISETTVGSAALILTTRIQFSCWAKTSDKAAASALALAVTTEAHNMEEWKVDLSAVAWNPRPAFPPSGLVTLHGAVVDQVLWDPDNTKTARYTVDVIVTSTTAS
jgi:hypothetical protein